MQTTKTTIRAYVAKSQKIQLLNELQSRGMTISPLARNMGISNEILKTANDVLKKIKGRKS